MYPNYEVCLLNTVGPAGYIMHVLMLCEELNTVDSPMF